MSGISTPPPAEGELDRASEGDDDRLIETLQMAQALKVRLEDVEAEISGRLPATFVASALLALAGLCGALLAFSRVPTSTGLFIVLSVASWVCAAFVVSRYAYYRAISPRLRSFGYRLDQGLREAEAALSDNL